MNTNHKASAHHTEEESIEGFFLSPADEERSFRDLERREQTLLDPGLQLEPDQAERIASEHLHTLQPSMLESSQTGFQKKEHPRDPEALALRLADELRSIKRELRSVQQELEAARSFQREVEALPEAGTQVVPDKNLSPAHDAQGDQQSRNMQTAAIMLSDQQLEDIKSLLLYLDHLLESLPDEKIQEFASSEYFNLYRKVFESLGLI
ncbi:MAG: hypothetical protein N2067_02405 [Spirochaetaceae bacterium]|nr:hypothetical protein [Spirochaetaceae bacterium]